MFFFVGPYRTSMRIRLDGVVEAEVKNLLCSCAWRDGDALEVTTRPEGSTKEMESMRFRTGRIGPVVELVE
jgi:hypothetical protein